MEENTANKNSYNKRPWWQWVTIYLVVAVLVYGGYYYFITKSGTYFPPSTASRNSTNITPTLQKFQDSPLASSAFQIFPGPLSDQAKQAIIGFNIDTKTQADGTVLVSLTSTNPEYKNQQVSVKPNYIVYFIEKSSGDDSPTDNSDRNLGDDSIVLVDPDGFIVQ